jgi:hypothetical protein
MRMRGWKWVGDLRVQICIIAALLFVIWMVLLHQYPESSDGGAPKRLRHVKVPFTAKRAVASDRERLDRQQVESSSSCKPYSVT